MTIVDIYYADAPRQGVWIEYVDGGDTGWRPIDLETALILQRRLARAIDAAMAAQAAQER